MYSININFENYSFNSVKREDFVTINEWLKGQGNHIELVEYTENFFAYYVGKNEIFIKIEEKGNIIGVFKGRVENEDDNKQLVILFYLIDEAYRGRGIGRKLLCYIIKYFNDKGFIENKVIVNAENDSGIEFWVKNGFVVKRRLSKYFDNEDMLILEN